MGTTAKEKKMQPEALIVSKTDTKGRITYCNDVFMEYSGYYEEELLGQPLTILHHPDIPKTVYRQMRETLLSENEFLGFIKNKQKEGGYYWTFINVTPSFSADNQLLGYFTVERYPHPDAIEFFQPLYQQMCEIEDRNDGAEQTLDISSDMLQQAVAEQGGYNEFICSYYQ